MQILPVGCISNHLCATTDRGMALCGGSILSDATIERITSGMETKPPDLWESPEPESPQKLTTVLLWL